MATHDIASVATHSDRMKRFLSTLTMAALLVVGGSTSAFADTAAPTSRGVVVATAVPDADASADVGEEIENRLRPRPSYSCGLPFMIPFTFDWVHICTWQNGKIGWWVEYL